MNRFIKSIIMTLLLLLGLGLEVLVLWLISHFFGDNVLIITGVVFLAFAVWWCVFSTIKKD